MQKDCEDKYLWTVPVSYKTDENKNVIFTEPEMAAHKKEKVHNRWIRWYEMIDR